MEGVHYYLGDNTGLQHSFVDSTVKNGFTYYYAVVSYDFGFPEGEIIPAESPIRISLLSNGEVRLGKNVARVTPTEPAAGYVAPTLGGIQHVDGTSTGKISYEIIDINKIKDGHVYYVTFEDTLKAASGPNVPDTLTTKNFTLVDSTASDTIIYKSENLSSDYEQPITDGFRLSFENEDRVELNKSVSGWNHEYIQNYKFEKTVSRYTEENGSEKPNDYLIIFSDSVGFGRSDTVTYGRREWPSKDVNFKVYNVSEKKFIEFGFLEIDNTGGEGYFTALGTNRDRIIFRERNSQDSLVTTWWLFMDGDTTGGLHNPTLGDTLKIILRKPFLSNDVYRFVAHAEKIDKDKAREDLKKIKVVPNPYVAQAKWEPQNPYNSGRGPRKIQFIHLPAQCTIKIFTVSGELVKEIKHDSPYHDGSEDWNMLSKDNLGISYGVYIYHVDAPGIGAVTGKFAIIK